MNTTTVKATEIVPGEHRVVRRAYTGAKTSSLVLGRTDQTLNNGVKVVRVDYGSGQGAMFYETADVTVEV